MKKKLLILALFVLLLSVLGYGTLAYGAVEGQAVNVITSGGVEIRLDETGADGRPFPDDGIRNVTPGTSCVKIVEVTNTGDHAAWVRVKVDLSPDTGILDPDYDDTHWQAREGYFYYLHPLEPGETTLAPLFRSVSFSAEMDDRYQGTTARVEVCAQAVQTENNGKTIWAARGWPAEA